MTITHRASPLAYPSAGLWNGQKRCNVQSAAPRNLPRWKQATCQHSRLGESIASSPSRSASRLILKSNAPEATVARGAGKHRHVYELPTCVGFIRLENNQTE